MTMRMSAVQARKLLAKPKRSKYRAVSVVVDGIRFDSKGEAVRWEQLKLRQRAGEIWNVKRQVRFPLHAAGDGMKIGEYIADFTYCDKKSHGVVVEDFKGAPPTPLARWKVKHLIAEYGVCFRYSGAYAQRKRS